MCVFVFSFHCVEEFPLSVCLREEKVKLCRTQLTLVFQSWDRRCLCFFVALIKAVFLHAGHPQVCMYTSMQTHTDPHIHTHNHSTPWAPRWPANCLEVIKLGGPLGHWEEEKYVFSSKRWTDTAPHHQGLSGNLTHTNRSPQWEVTSRALFTNTALTWLQIGYDKEKCMKLSMCLPVWFEDNKLIAKYSLLCHHHQWELQNTLHCVISFEKVTDYCVCV